MLLNTFLTNLLAVIAGASGFILSLLGADAGNTIPGWWSLIGFVLLGLAGYLSRVFSTPNSGR